MTQIISAYGGYRNTYSFVYACLIYHATTTFCHRNYTYKNDSLGKTVGQMIGAARSARQNIVEGSSRAGTSKETELRLYDVAKGSLEELAGDYEAFLTEHEETPWAHDEPQALQMADLKLAPFKCQNHDDVRHDFGNHILEMRKRFGAFLEAQDPIVAANSILIAIDQACRLLHCQMDTIAEAFRSSGGFTERLSKARLETRDHQIAAEGSPVCPKCGKPMRKVVARKGRNAGNAFWSCSGYPECTGTRPL